MQTVLCTAAPHLPLPLFRLSSVAGSNAAALTGGFQLALWVCGLTGLAAVPVAFGLIRRQQKAATAATAAKAQPRELAAVRDPLISAVRQP